MAKDEEVEWRRIKKDLYDLFIIDKSILLDTGMRVEEETIPL